jgi:hypothetical protein
MITIHRYSDTCKEQWDDFITASRNGTFLFYRDYMEYHRERFRDHSLMIYNDSQLIAVLPASETGGVLTSHGGLTYGGFVYGQEMRVPVMLEVFGLFMDYARQQQLRTIVYKPVPHIYHRMPAEEDLYALFVNDAKLIRRDVSTTILLSTRLSYSKGRKWAMNKGRKAGIAVQPSLDFATFMRIEEDSLMAKHGCKPVHTAEELASLATRFPNGIRLFAGFREGKMLGGVIVYETDVVVHTQYISATQEGMECGALDVVMDYVIGQHSVGRRYFDFGISCTQQGRQLDVNLVSNKESFGGRATVYDFYELAV